MLTAFDVYLIASKQRDMKMRGEKTNQSVEESVLLMASELEAKSEMVSQLQLASMRARLSAARTEPMSEALLAPQTGKQFVLETEPRLGELLALQTGKQLGLEMELRSVERLVQLMVRLLAWMMELQLDRMSGKLKARPLVELTESVKENSLETLSE